MRNRNRLMGLLALASVIVISGCTPIPSAVMAITYQQKSGYVADVWVCANHIDHISGHAEVAGEFDHLPDWYADAPIENRGTVVLKGLGDDLSPDVTYKLGGGGSALGGGYSAYGPWFTASDIEALRPGDFLVRDLEDPELPTVVVDEQEWEAMAALQCTKSYLASDTPSG